MIGDGTLVVVATYNERENLEALASQVFENAPGCHLLVVDDNSPDGTGEIAHRMSALDDRVEVLDRPTKLGLGTAYMAGFSYALARDHARVVTMDADFSHHPRYLPAILNRADGAGIDLVIGSRYVPGGGVVGWSIQRRLLSFGANMFARLLLGLRTHDNTGAYRCYSRRLVAELDSHRVVSNGYSALIEIIWQCQRVSSGIAEIPIVFADRELGQSKVSRTEIFRGLTTVLRLRFGRVRASL